MQKSKAWDWKKEEHPIWLSPSEESYYIANRWKAAGYKSLIDFGCGLGRHSVFFAQQGFDVSAFDLSKDGVCYLKSWAERENLSIDVKVADMLALPYPDDAFDCLYAFHVISHTDTAGIRKILQEIKRIVKPGGEIFTTLCSKDTWSYKDAGYPKIDENTVRKTSEGPEKDVPHFYVAMDDIINLFSEVNIELLRVRHTDDCYRDGQRQNSMHYFVLARNPSI